jgi:hypothetical protein
MADEVVTRLARSLEIATNAIEAARVARAAQGNLDAQDLALRCQAGFDTSTRFSAEQAAAYDLCDRALEIDGRNVIALNILAVKYIAGVGDGLSADREADLQRAVDLLARALALEPDNDRAHTYMRRRWSKRSEASLSTQASSRPMPPCAMRIRHWGDRKR